MFVRLFIFFILLSLNLSVFADDLNLDSEQILKEENTIQQRINKCAYRILNLNKISKRVVFVYDNSDKKAKLKTDSKLTKREVIIYRDYYKYIENDDELAAFLSREIFIALRSFDGISSGFLRSLQVSAAPKKYEMAADKRAVDYMVNSGFNPIALIIYIQKTSPQRRFDKISNHNLTSKRLAVIYEYIYTKYPYFLKNNSYLDNEYYQNFLLTSQNNRRMLEEKIKTGSREKLKYE